MTASELHRKLLYKGHSELSAHLEENLLNHTLYHFLREVKPRHQVNMSMASILNEVWFVCIRASRDLTPGDNIHERYILEVKSFTGSTPATELICCLVYMVLSAQKELSYTLQCFLQELYRKICFCDFMHETRDYMNLHKEELQHIESDFTPQPVAVSELPVYTETTSATIIEQIMYDYSTLTNPWRAVTNGFAQTAILDFLRCYHAINDQRMLLERIKESSKASERMEMEGFYTETFELIEMGEFLPRMTRKPTASDTKKTDLSIAYQQIESLKQQMEDLKESYNTKLVEQRADFDRRLSRMECQYKAELEANKAVEQTEKQQQEAAAEPSFTITELVTHACNQCSRQSADAVTTMLYRLAGIHGYTDPKTIAKIDSIIPTIDLREARRQTLEFPNVSQFNNNPTAVNNNYGTEPPSDNQS